MNTIQNLTIEQIKQYQDLVKEQGIDAVPGIYAALNDMGFGYAGWCYGVATGDTITGMGALDFMQETAPKTISPAKVDQIRVGMLNGYLSALELKARENGSFVNEEIRFEIIRDFHVQVFKDNQLDISYWTLETPMKIIRENFGPDLIDQKWEELTQTNGTGADALLSSLILVDWVNEASHGTIYLDKDNHLITRAELVINPTAYLKIAQIKDVSAYTKDAEEWLARLPLGGAGSAGHYVFEQFVTENSYWKVGDQSQVGQKDIFSVPSGEDVSYVYGLGGDDKIYGWDSKSNLGESIDTGYSAKDHFYGGTGDDELYGGGNQDQLYGEMGNDKLYGGIGDDILYGGKGSDELHGGEGNDVLIVSELNLGSETSFNVALLDDSTVSNEAYGDAGNDHIYGGNGSDELYGGDDHDKLVGIGGVDFLYGGNGNDTLLGGAENDELYGDEGNDALYGGDGNDKADGGKGNDLIIGGMGELIADGGEDNDTIYGNHLKDKIKGGSGNDVIIGLNGLNELEGGDGNDLVTGGNDQDDLYGGKGNDIINGYDGENNLYGGSGNNLVVGGKDKDTFVISEYGTNILAGQEENDTYGFFSTTIGSLSEFGFGTSLIKDATGTILIEGAVLNIGEYDQNLKAWKSSNGLYIIRKLGEDTDKTIISIHKVGDEKNTIYVDGWKNNGDMGLSFSAPPVEEIPTTDGLPTLNDGNNIAYNQNKTNAGGGNDYIDGTNSADVLDGGSGNNYINGWDGNDLIKGGNNKDIILGGDGQDIIYGGAGDDVLLGSVGWKISPGVLATYLLNKYKANIDKDATLESLTNIIINNSKNNWNINFSFQPIFDEDAESYNYYLVDNGITTTTILPKILINVVTDGETHQIFSSLSITENADEQTGEIIYGGVGNDFIMGSRGTDILYGDNDNDHLYGQSGDDYLYGGHGNDVIEGGAGRDYISGGTNDDELVGGYEADVIYGGDGNDNIIGDLANLFGTDAPPLSADESRYGNDLIYAGDGEDNVSGNGGDDIIYGGEQQDNITGGTGNDFLYGDSGIDNIWGEEDDDYLFGGSDNDHLFGGIGNDILLGESGDDNIKGEDGDDIIYGGIGNDIFLFGGKDNDIIYGGENNDKLYGEDGNDILFGGTGNDQLIGGQGSDLYVFDLGDGKDTIKEEVSDIASLNHQNFIYFTFDPSAIREVSRDNFNLIIKYGTNDQVTVTDYYKVRNSSNHSYLENQQLFDQIEISEVRFADGTSWNTATIMEMAPPPDVNELPPDALDGVAYFIDALVTRDMIAVQGKTIITYAFPADSASGNKPYFQEQMLAVEQALNKFAHVLNITFVKSETGIGDLKFYLDDLTSAEAGAAAGYASAQTGEIHINSTMFKTADSLNQGEYGFEVLLHEIGHAFGLEHPFEAPVLPELENTQNNTVMSYTSNGVNDTELKPYDIAALQYLHGVNQGVRAENNTYNFATKFIWDGGGIDTFDASSEIQNVYIDLNAGALSYVDQKKQSILAQGQSFIGYGTVIENAIAGVGNDILVSNEANNILQGELGDDTYIFNENFGRDEIIEVDHNNVLIIRAKVVEGRDYYLNGGLNIGSSFLIFNISNFSSFIINEIEITQDQFIKKYKYKEILTSTILDDDEVGGVVLNDLGVSVTGNNKDNFIFGADGNDQIFGGQGSDNLYGEIGDDYLEGEAGNDQLEGGDENDQLKGGEGDDYLFGGSGNDYLEGEAGNDQLEGGDENDQLKGGEGNDYLEGGRGNDLLEGGKGADIYHFRIGDGIDEIKDNDEMIISFLDVSSDEVVIERFNNELKIYYGENDEIIFNNPGYGISKIIFNDTEWSSTELLNKIINKVVGTEGDDLLLGTQNNYPETIYALSGDDYIYSGRGDSVYGGFGKDTIEAKDSENIIAYGEDGDDIFDLFRVSHSKFYGGDGNDDFKLNTWGNEFQGNYLEGGKGYDTYDISNGDSFIQNGVSINDEDGLGKIFLNYSVIWAYVHGMSGSIDYTRLDAEYNYSTGILSYKYFGKNVFSLVGIFDVNDITRLGNLEVNIQGASYEGGTVYQPTNDKLLRMMKGTRTDFYYTNSDDVINDLIESHLSNRIYAQDGNDLINIVGQSYHVFGGFGDDIINTHGGVILGEEGNDTLTNAGEFALLFGGDGNDVLRGAGDLYGEDGNDVLTGAGNLYGGNGDDQLLANNNGALMDGGEGVDHLVGGLGDDTFVVDEFDTYEENDPDGGYDTIHIAQSFDLALNNFEAVTLLGFQDFNAFGDEYDNKIIGNSGNNHLEGYLGDDTLEGGGGDDILNGDLGSDIMRGNDGNDYYIVDTADSIIFDVNGNKIVKQGDLVQEDDDNGIDTIERWTDSKFIGKDENGGLILTNSYNILEKNVENLVLKGNATIGFGNDLSNIIIGNEQNNYIDGLVGDDTYIYNFGGGKDTFVFKDSIDSFNSLIINGYDQSQIYARQSGNNLTINFKNNLNDQITINHYFLDDDLENDISYKQDEIQLSNGFILDSTWIENSLHNLEGTDGNDTIWGSSRAENISGGAGNDTLIGGTGSDTLDGGAGDDKYFYYLTDGPDVIDQTGGGVDVLWLMDNGITRDRIQFTKEENDLIVTIDNNANQSVRIVDHFLGGEKAISAVQPNNGYTISKAEINALFASEIEEPNPPIEGGIYDTSASDALVGGTEDNIFFYTAGKDTIQDAGGIDILRFSNGITFNQVGSGLMKTGNDLVLKVNGSTTNQVTLKNYFLAGDHLIETIDFETGGQLTAEQIFNAFGVTLPETEEETGSTDVVGDTTYQYTTGELTITEQSGTDKVIFKNGIGFSQVSSYLNKSGNDLILKVDGSNTNKVIVKNFFLAGQYLVESFQFETGGQLSAEQIFGAFGITMPTTEPENPTEPESVNVVGNTTYDYTTGALTITEQSGNDKVVFKNGIGFSQVANYLTMSGNDLILKVDGSNTNKVTVKNFFLAGEYLVETFQFETGGQITAEQIFGAFGLTVPEQNNPETTQPETGLEAMNSTYTYTSGTLQIDEDYGVDEIVFSNGISFNQVASQLMMSGDDLVLKIDGSNTDKVTIKNFFLGGAHEVESLSFETGGSISSSQIYQAFGLDRPLNAEDEVSAVVLGDTGDNTLMSDAAVSELFILDQGQDIIQLLQNASGETAKDYVSDFSLVDDKIDLSAVFVNSQVNDANLDDYLQVFYDADAKTNTLSVRTSVNNTHKDMLIFTNQAEQLYVDDLLLNQSITY